MFELPPNPPWGLYFVIEVFMLGFFAGLNMYVGATVPVVIGTVIAIAVATRLITYLVLGKTFILDPAEMDNEL